MIRRDRSILFDVGFHVLRVWVFLEINLGRGYHVWNRKDLLDPWDWCLVIGRGWNHDHKRDQPLKVSQGTVSDLCLLLGEN